MTASARESATYEFGPFRLDAADKTLARDGQPVALPPKVMETLLVLVTRAGRLVTKEELMAAVWPDTFVDESNLSQNVFRLRKVLGHDDYIVTVPRRGYRFACPVRERASVPVPPPVAHARRRPMWLAATLTAAVVVGALALTRRSHPDSAALPRFEKLTTDSRSFDPAISADGRFVAYAVLEGEQKSIWLQNLSGGRPMQVMPPTVNDYRGLRISPNGRELFYKTFPPGAAEGLIERVPLFGGAPKQVAADVWSDFSLSPDGRQVAFVRGSTRPNENMLLVVAQVDGGGERVVARNVTGKTWFLIWDVAPSWSPDGQRIAVCGGWHAPGGDRDVIYDVRVSDGAPTELHTPPWASIERAEWAGAATLAVAARESSAKPAQIWLLDVASGAARRVTNDLAEYGKVGLTADANALVVEQRASPAHLWYLPDGEARRARQLTFGESDSDGRYGLSWTPSGRLLFASDRTGEFEIWSMKPDGTDLRQLTANSAGWNQSPVATPDGRAIVFASARTGLAQIWRADADGGHPLQLTHGHSHQQPELSPDGQWVYATDADVAPVAINRVPVSGGAQERVVNGWRAAVSPDGAALMFHRPAGNRSQTVIAPVGGGDVRPFDFDAERDLVRWTPDGKGLAYIKPGTTTNVWLQPVGGGAARPLTDFTEQHVWNFAFAPDGRSLAVSRGSNSSDIVLISGLRSSP